MGGKELHRYLPGRIIGGRVGASTLRETSRNQLDTLMTTNDLSTAFLPATGPSLLKVSSFGEKGGGFSGTSIKGTWTKPKDIGSRVGSGDGWGGGRVLEGKWRQLYLNYNKKNS